MVGVVIPCFKVKDKVIELIGKIGSEITAIYVVDDACPENSGAYVEENCNDERLKVIYHHNNKGVDGAVKTGYKKAIEDNMEIVIKLDEDGQMDPSLIPELIKPVKKFKADYVKGNRFYEPESLKQMPGLRVMGNAVLSFVNKMVNAYWNIMDLTSSYGMPHWKEWSKEQKETFEQMCGEEMQACGYELKWE